MNNYLEQEIIKILKDEHGIIEEELDQNSKTIIEITADIIKARLGEMKELNDRIRFLEIDIENKEIMIENLQEEKSYLMDEIDDLQHRGGWERPQSWE